MFEIMIKIIVNWADARRSQDVGVKHYFSQIYARPSHTLRRGYLQCSLVDPSSAVPIIVSGATPPSTHSTRESKRLCEVEFKATLAAPCPNRQAPGPPQQWSIPGMRNRR